MPDGGGYDVGYGGYDDGYSGGYGLASLIGDIVSLLTPKKKASPAETAAVPNMPPLPPGAEGVYMSAQGAWLLFKEGHNCSVAFGRDGNMLVFGGPAGRRPGGITFMGPKVPPTDAPAQVQLTLTADGKPITVKGLHLPAGPKGALIVPTVIEDTMASIGDSEKVAVKLNGKTVFSVQTVGAHSARDALLGCLH